MSSPVIKCNKVAVKKCITKAKGSDCMVKHFFGPLGAERVAKWKETNGWISEQTVKKGSTTLR
jgi:hypothetical protein